MNEPVAWMSELGTCYSAEDITEMSKNIADNFTIPLYTQQRPHNTVLVPCDKLAEMQAEIEALKAENKSLIAELEEWEDDYEQ